MLEFYKHYRLESNNLFSLQSTHPQVFCYSDAKWAEATGVLTKTQ